MNETMPAATDDLFAEEKSEGFGLTGFIAVVLLIGAVAWSALLYTERAKLQNQIQENQVAIENVQEYMRSVQQNENISDQIASATILRSVQKKAVTWSPLIAKVQRLESEDLRFVSYSTNRDNQVFITGKAPNYSAVAALSETIKAEGDLADTFVDSIVLNTTSSSRSRPSLVTIAEPETDVQFQLVFDFTPTKS